MMKVFSFGGGVQSMAALVLSAQRKIDYETFLFCNVGDDSEYPATLDYVSRVAKPYAHAYGLTLIELERTRRDGSVETLYGRLTRPGSRSIGLPVRMNGSGAPGNRACTADFKIKVVARWLREHGATPRDPAIVALGISLDEFGRMRTDSGIAYERLVYPLIDLRLDRAQCMQIIRDAGLPVPPKSACTFCPFHTQRRWQEMRNHEPALFWKSVDLERFLNERRASLGLDPVWFHRKLVPLDQATCEEEQLTLFCDEDDTDDVCESGYCFL